MKNPESTVRMWEVPGHSIQISFSEAFLDALRVTARLQLSRPDYSTVEAKKGLLLGESGPPIRPEESLPLGAAVSDHEGRAVVGWYALRRSTELNLLDEDIKHLTRTPAGDSEFGLLIRPVDGEAVRIAVFFREENGNVRAGSSYRELLVLPPKESPSSPVAAALATAPKPKPTVVRESRAAQPPSPRVLTLSLNSPTLAMAAPLETAAKSPAARRLGSLVLASLLASILVMITFLEFYGFRGATASPANPVAPATKPVPTVIRPGAVALQPATPVVRTKAAAISDVDDVLGKNRQLTANAERLTGELAAQRDHNRRMEMLVDELRERRSQGPARTPARAAKLATKIAHRMEP